MKNLILTGFFLTLGQNLLLCIPWNKFSPSPAHVIEVSFMLWAAPFSRLSIPVPPHHFSHAATGSLFTIMLGLVHTQREWFPQISVIYLTKRIQSSVHFSDRANSRNIPRMLWGTFKKCSPPIPDSLQCRKMNLRSLKFNSTHFYNIIECSFIHLVNWSVGSSANCNNYAADTRKRLSSSAPQFSVSWGETPR